MAVPEVQPGTRTEIEVPSGTDIDLTFTPDAGFKIGSVIVDDRIWSTNAVWRYEAAKADKSFSASYIPNPQTTVAWESGTDGRWYATLSFKNHNGYAEALGDLAFLFADKVWMDGSVLTTNYLQRANASPRTPVEMHDDLLYRRVDFDESPLQSAREGESVSFGGKNLRSDDGIVRLYSRKRDLDALVGCLTWETNGKRYYQPVVGDGAMLGIVAEDIITAEKFNQARSLGFDPAFLATATPSCRFTDFSPEPAIDGWFEVYAATPEGIEAVSSGTTDKAVFHLWGTDRLGGEWTELVRATFPEKDGGSVRFLETSSDLGDVQFFRVTIEVTETYE